MASAVHQLLPSAVSRFVAAARSQEACGAFIINRLVPPAVFSNPGAYRTRPSCASAASTSTGAAAGGCVEDDGEEGSSSAGASGSSVLDVRHPVMILQEWAQHQGEGSFPAAFEMVDRVRKATASDEHRRDRSAESTDSESADPAGARAEKRWWTTLRHRRSGISVTSGPFSKKKLSRRESAYKLVAALESAGHRNIQLQNWMPLRLVSDLRCAADELTDGAVDGGECVSVGLDGLMEAYGQSSHSRRYRRDGRLSPEQLARKLHSAALLLRRQRGIEQPADAHDGAGDRDDDHGDDGEFFERFIESKGNGAVVEYTVEVAHRPPRPLPKEVSIKVGRALSVMDAKMTACHRLLASLKGRAKEEEKQIRAARAAAAAPGGHAPDAGNGPNAVFTSSSALRDTNTRNLEALMGDKILDVLAIYHLKSSNPANDRAGSSSSSTIGNDIVGRHDNTLPRSYSDFLARKTCNEALAAKVTQLGLQPTGTCCISRRVEVRCGARIMEQGMSAIRLRVCDCAARLCIS